MSECGALVEWYWQVKTEVLGVPILHVLVRDRSRVSAMGGERAVFICLVPLCVTFTFHLILLVSHEEQLMYVSVCYTFAPTQTICAVCCTTFSNIPSARTFSEGTLTVELVT